MLSDNVIAMTTVAGSTEANRWKLEIICNSKKEVEKILKLIESEGVKND